MGKVNVLIIEDTKAESDALTAVLELYNYNIVGVATTYKDALTLFYEKTVDIIVIDVFLSGKPEGITFAETISITPGSARPFVFLTSSKDRQIFERAKLTQPFSFLLKPFNELEVLYALEMALEKFYAQTTALTGNTSSAVVSDDYLFIKKKKSLKKVYISEILYVEVEERYCNIYTESEKFVILISLVKMIGILDNRGFVRTHRNYLVNEDCIQEIVLNENTIHLKGGAKVPLSDKYKDITQNISILSNKY